jgi:mannose-6-phosphate isomerase-like protein (cupin superfamily)
MVFLVSTNLFDKWAMVLQKCNSGQLKMLKSRQLVRFVQQTRANHFVVSHQKDSDYSSNGLRPCFSYRDLNIKFATNNKFNAHIVKANEKLKEKMGIHEHGINFQMVYVLKGWIKIWYEGQGEITLVENSCVNQPPGILHEVRDFSEDMELLEITSPGEFETIDH